MFSCPKWRSLAKNTSGSAANTGNSSSIPMRRRYVRRDAFHRSFRNISLRSIQHPDGRSNAATARALRNRVTLSRSRSMYAALLSEWTDPSLHPFSRRATLVATSLQSCSQIPAAAASFRFRPTVMWNIRLPGSRSIQRELCVVVRSDFVSLYRMQRILERLPVCGDPPFLFHPYPAI
jgi:hypothetical protein